MWTIVWLMALTIRCMYLKNLAHRFQRPENLTLKNTMRVDACSRRATWLTIALPNTKKWLKRIFLYVLERISESPLSEKSIEKAYKTQSKIWLETWPLLLKSLSRMRLATAWVKFQTRGILVIKRKFIMTTQILTQKLPRRTLVRTN